MERFFLALLTTLLLILCGLELPNNHRVQSVWPSTLFSESESRLSVLQWLHLYCSREYHGHTGHSSYWTVRRRVYWSLTTKPGVSEHRKSHIFFWVSPVLPNRSQEWKACGQREDGLRVWPGQWEVRDDHVGGRTAASQSVGNETGLWPGTEANWTSFRHERRVCVLFVYSLFAMNPWFECLSINYPRNYKSSDRDSM